MGKPKFSKKKYETPNHPWKETRIKAENELVAKYGLKNKREIWKAETTLRKYRGQARGLLASVGSEDSQAKKETHQLISHLTRYNILPLNSTLDDVLALNTEIVLSRRLQTLTYLKGFASTAKQARQLINHGHIAIAGRCINVPGYRVTKNEEKDIDYTQDSPLNDSAHPARPSGDFVSKMTGGSESPVPDQPIPARKSQDVKPAGKPVDVKPVEKPKVASDEKNKDTKKEKPVKTTSETKEKKSEEKKEKPSSESKKEKPSSESKKEKPSSESKKEPIKEKQEKKEEVSKPKESQEKSEEKPKNKGSDA